MRRSSLLVLTWLPLLAGCLYSFQAGTGLTGAETIAILPFENRTSRLELTQEIQEVMLRNLPRNLGLNPAGEEVADVVVRGEITRYDLSAPSYRPAAGGGGGAAEVLQREVTIAVSVQLLDMNDRVILWENTSLRAVGQFLEATETEEAAKEQAIEILIQEIVDGAQEGW
jgi:TolB-like protein